MPQILRARLIGREAELQQLRPLLEGATQGHGGFALVTGEAGIGKTRFVTAALDSLDDPSVVRVFGGCLKELQLLPYAPVAEALRSSIVGGLAPAPQHVDPYLLHLLPELDPGGAPVGGESVESGAVRYRLAHAACGLLESWADRAPVVVLLEDVHWADSATREMIPLLARRTVGRSLLIIATCRSDEEDADRLRSLLELITRGGHTTIHLDPLTSGEVGEMISSTFAVAGPVSGEFSHAMHERTSGNPFFVEELLTTLVDAGGIFRRDGVWDRDALAGLEVPGTIRDAILRRVAGLPDEEQQMLRVASAVGQKFDLETYARILALSDDAAIRAVRTLVDKQFLTQEEAGLRFRHAVTRETIYGELLEAERAALHRRVAKTLEEVFVHDLGAHVTELAHHYRIAGETAKARTYAERACERDLRLGAAEEARSHLSTMLDLAESEAETAGLLRRMGNLDRHLGRLDRSIANLERAAALYSQLGERRLRGVTLIDLSMSVLMNGYNAEALNLRLEALALLEPFGAGEELALAYRSLGHHYMLSSNYLEASRWSHQAIALGADIGADEIVNDARIDLSVCDFQLGSAGGAVANLRTALELAQKRGWEAQSGRASLNLSDILILGGRYEEAIAVCRGGIERGTRTGLHFWGSLCRGTLGKALRLRGVWAEADEVLTELVREGHAFASRKYSMAGLCELAPLRADQGRWDEARDMYEDLWPLCLERDELQHHAPALTTAARIAAALGEPDEAWERLEFLRNYWSEGTDDNILVGPAFLVAAELAVSTGDPRRGLEWLTLLEDTSSKSPSPETSLFLAEARGVVGGALGEDGALDSLRHAVDGWRELGRPFDAGRALRLLGELLLSRDDQADAVSHLNEAAAVFADLGAAHELKLTQAALRRAGVTVPRGPHASTRSRPGGLTARELEVARLVAEGKSNAQVAQALVVSTKTAATHVGHILSKLGFSSRAEIARWVVEMGLATASDGEK